ncbi:hypothetical protein Aam_090_018 [Acidocella aminolytica 101 = DSM 11237]|uniref:Uncharacterized protein n=1 Tax=Acidocella aminolytica 101 = DSM 11237 TaxID=1120923 RepID=A0A0D6PHU2_9PROT|nr:hypothetical protein Aam_090_018 [Acidocella aminolytica 101 = DSM 11237]
MAQHAINRLSCHIGQIQRQPDGKCPAETGWRMAMPAQPMMMPMIVMMVMAVIMIVVMVVVVLHQGLAMVIRV